MPWLNLKTSIELNASRSEELLAGLSSATARLLGKPESYVMVAIEPGLPMMIGAETGPTCFLDLRTLGDLPAEKTAKLSAELTGVLTEALGVPAERVFLNFASVERHLWGHAGRTFG